MTGNMYLWRIWNIKVAIFILEQRWIFKPHCTANDTWSISSSTSEVSEPCRPAHGDSLKLQDSVLKLIALRWATSRHQQVTASTWGVKIGSLFRIHRHGHWWNIDRRKELVWHKIGKMRNVNCRIHLCNRCQLLLNHGWSGHGHAVGRVRCDQNVP